MKHQSRLSLAAAASLLLLAPLNAFAHQNEVFRIGDKTYSLTVGSLNEPVAVDDKTGVYVNISLAPDAAETGEEDHHGNPESAVLGLEKTLKAEVIAGDKKKNFDLAPIRDEPGGYRAVFIPTVQTTLTYRFFGTINDVPIDLSFTCNPAGHPVSEEDATPVSMGANVTRVLKKGAFGCPTARADLGFPEPAATLYEINQSVHTKPGIDFGVVGTVLGALGLAAGIAGLMRGRITI